MPRVSDEAIDVYLGRLNGAAPEPGPRRASRRGATLDEKIDAYLSELPAEAPPSAPTPMGRLTGVLSESAQKFPSYFIEGVPEAIRAAVETQGLPTFGEALRAQGTAPGASFLSRVLFGGISPLPSALTLAEQLSRLPVSFQRAAAELGPEQAKPLTEALAGGALLIGPQTARGAAGVLPFVGRRLAARAMTPGGVVIEPEVPPAARFTGQAGPEGFEILEPEQVTRRQLPPSPTEPRALPGSTRPTRALPEAPTVLRAEPVRPDFEILPPGARTRRQLPEAPRGPERPMLEGQVGLPPALPGEGTRPFRRRVILGPESPLGREGVRPPAPANFLAWQARGRGQTPIALYNLTEPVAGHPVGDTLSAETLRELGYEPPFPPLPSRFEPTRFGTQGVLAETPGRAMPPTALRATAPQQEVTSSPLFEPKPTAEQVPLPQAPRKYAGQFYGSTVTPGTVDLTSPEEVRVLARDYGGISRRGLDIEVPEALLARPGAGVAYDEFIAEIAAAQSRDPKDVERALVSTLNRYGTTRGELRTSGLMEEIRGANPPSDIPVPLEEWRAMPPGQRQSLVEFFRAERAAFEGGEGGEAGRIRAGLAARLGSTAAGTAIGGTQGETPEERLRNALLGGAAGAMVPSAYRFARGLGERGGYRFSTPPPEPFKTPADVPRTIVQAETAARAPMTATEILRSGLSPAEVTAARALSGPAAIVDGLKKGLAPATRGPAAVQTAGILRSQLADLARKTEVARTQLRRYERVLEGLPEDARLAFIDAIETGRAVPDAQHAPIAATLRRLLDERRQQVQKLGKLEHYIEDYYPHLWKDPDRTAAVIGQVYGRRPLAGPGSFLKQRKIPTVREGLELGLEPLTTNPATATLLRLREMDRYVAGQTILREMQETGLARLIPYEAKPPSGWVPIHDKIARAGSAGQYWVPEPAARVLNNHLSPGLQGNPAYDALRGLGNTLNQAQLGFSAFHLGFVTFDTTTSKAALAIQQLFAGRPVQAAKNIIATPVAPFTSFLKGSKVLREYYAPGAGGAEMAGVIDHLIRAGGRARMDYFYGGTALDEFFLAMRGGRYGHASLKAFPALLETVAKPVMEHFVPRVKLGVFADLAEFEMSKLPPTATRADVTRVLGRAWDSVDNRLGQLVYDNLFWKRTFKDTMLAGVRSVGWNLGTMRELGGGVADVARMAGRAARGRPIEMTPRMAYTTALPFVVGLYGAAYQYLATGEGPRELRDYFYPRTGRTREDGSPDRVNLPSYMKDIFAYWRAPYQTIKGKINPSVATVFEMLENKDFYGAAIRNPDDPLVVQMLDEVEHVVGSFESFSWRAFRQELEAGASVPQAAQGFFGITPAPMAAVRDPEDQAEVERLQRAQAIRRKEREEERSLSPLRGLKERLRQ